MSSSSFGSERLPQARFTRNEWWRSADPANLAAVGLDELVRAVGDILAGCRRLLRPGGVVAMTLRPWRHRGELIDLPGAIGKAGEAAGLVLFGSTPSTEEMHTR